MGLEPISSKALASRANAFTNFATKAFKNLNSMKPNNIEFIKERLH